MTYFINGGVKWSSNRLPEGVLPQNLVARPLRRLERRRLHSRRRRRAHQLPQVQREGEEEEEEAATTRMDVIKDIFHPFIEQCDIM